MITTTSIYMDKDINVKIIISFFFSQIQLTFFFHFLAFLGRHLESYNWSLAVHLEQNRTENRILKMIFMRLLERLTS